MQHTMASTEQTEGAHHPHEKTIARAWLWFNGDEVASISIHSFFFYLNMHSQFDCDVCDSRNHAVSSCMCAQNCSHIVRISKSFTFQRRSERKDQFTLIFVVVVFFEFHIKFIFRWVESMWSARPEVVYVRRAMDLIYILFFFEIDRWWLTSAGTSEWKRFIIVAGRPIHKHQFE